MLKLVEVSKMYYESNMTQAQIANKIGVSRPMISKMLNKAKELGIVKIEIRPLFFNNDSILNEMKKLYKIESGLIVPEAKTEFLTNKTILSHSVMYIKQMLLEDCKIGIGWGYATSNIVDEFKKNEGNFNKEGNVYPLLGTANMMNKAYHPNDLIRNFAESIKFHSNFIYAPAFPHTLEERNIYLKTENYQSISANWEDLDTIILAVENYPQVPDQATALRFGKKLVNEKAVGSFLSYYYNEEGKIIKSNKDFVIQIPLEKILKTKKVIAICLDCSIEAMIGALKSGYITHIITDEKKAMQVIMNQ